MTVDVNAPSTSFDEIDAARKNARGRFPLAALKGWKQTRNDTGWPADHSGELPFRDHISALHRDTAASTISMSKSEKLLERMRANPRGWRIESLEAIARRYGVQIRKTGGSHFFFVHPDSLIAVSVPFKRPIKPVYITHFLALIEDIGARE